MSGTWEEAPPSPNTLGYARASAILGIIAMTMCVFGCCTSQMSTCGSIPVAAIGLVLARLSAQADDREAKAYSNVGLATSVITLLYAALVVAAVALYLLLYFGMIAVMIIAGP